MPLRGTGICLLASLAGCAMLTITAALPQTQDRATGSNDIPKTFTAPVTGYDYIKREVMIPMRDGVKLHTVIVVPRGAKDAPILLTRTPYNASKRTARNDSP